MFKKMLAAVLIFSGLSAYHYYTVRMPEARRARIEAEGGPLLPVSSYDEILAVRIARPAGETIKIEKKSGAWWLSEPVVGRADFLKANGLAMALSQAEKGSRFWTRPSEFDRYELTDPHTIVTVWPASAPEAVTVMVGQKHPIRDAYYGRLMRFPEETFFLDGNLVRALDKSTYALREKQLFWFQDDDVRRITIRLFGTFVRLYRGTDRRWHLQDAPDAAVDRESVIEFLHALKRVYVKAFMADGEISEKKAGIQKGKHYVALVMTDGRAEMLDVGRAIGKHDAYYVRKRPDDGPLVTVARRSIHALARAPEDFMDRRIIQLMPDDIQTFEITREGMRQVYRRTASDGWVKLDPAGTPQTGENAISRIIEEVRSLKQNGTVPQARYEPLASFRFIAGDRGRAAQIDFLRDGPEIYVSNPGEQKIYSVPEADLEAIGTLIDTLQPVS